METTIKNKPKISTNLDTNFLKIVAIITMLSDHIGKAFFPDILILQIIGRITYPIFAYCMVVGVLYTHDIKKYIIRLGAFAFISQIPWIFAFNPSRSGFIENWFVANIFFTLIAGAVFTYGLKEKNWLLIIISLVALSSLNLDYGFDTIALVACFYLLRKKPSVACILSSIILGLSLLTSDELSIFGFKLGMQGFSMLAIPLIYFKTNFNLKINKYFFYMFYPLHLLVIFFIRVILHI